MLVVDAVARYTINYTHVGSGRTAANIIDVWIAENPDAAGRAAEVAGIAAVLLDAWHANIRPKQADEVTLQSVSWTDLNAENGSTGVMTDSGTNTWPVAGGTSGECLPFNTCALVRKSMVADRSRRQGRMYIPGIPEADVSSGYTLTGTARPLWQTEFDDLHNALEGTTIINGNSVVHYPAVVHVLTRDANGNPLTGDHRPVTGFSVQQVLATQRRRLRK